ncbi:uncharacterized protein LOC133159653 [Syngnathus typhle]|uniref:uncharacterized protein LOC133159653 n=1 Tax=Syngnathus typhle TaxID=161592 RepID=UPI002A69C345|nr:uncharacterized protein LOC133159653 [Syngnathus typhle]
MCLLWFAVPITPVNYISSNKRLLTKFSRYTNALRAILSSCCQGRKRAFILVSASQVRSTPPKMTFSSATSNFAPQSLPSDNLSSRNFHRRRIKSSCRFLIKRIKSCVYSNKYEPDAEDFPMSTRTSSVGSRTESMKPSFTKKIKFQSILEGEPVVFECQLLACPPPVFLWFHNNRSIPKMRRRRICTEGTMHIHTSSLLIDSVREKDSGSYKVMAINSEGSAESTASLLVSLRGEQSANYLGYVRRPAEVHKSAAWMSEQRKGRKIRVDLRYVGSPFDKISKVNRQRTRSKTGLVRTVFFHSNSYWREKESGRESKCLETASERAPSPQPMFVRSDGFDDRWSDIYCDRRTGTRFSEKFSDRCSDGYSERFSDTESLHNEVKSKLSALQKAVRQRKRLSISTVSSTEFDCESVASDWSYADNAERLRVKPSVQHSKSAFDFGQVPRECRGPEVSAETSRPHVRHSFEPQSRSRAVQIMRGEPVDVAVPKCQTKECADEVQLKQSDEVKEEMRELHIRGGDDQVTEELEPYPPEPTYLPKSPKHPEFPHKPRPTSHHEPPHQSQSKYYEKHACGSETTDHHEPPQSPQFPHPHNSQPLASEDAWTYTEHAKEDFWLRESQKFDLVKSVMYHVSPEEWEHTPTTVSNDASLKVPCQSLDDHFLDHGGTSLSLHLRKGSRVAEDERSESETGLPKPSETPYAEPKEQEVSKITLLEPKAMSRCHQSPEIKAQETHLEVAAVPELEVRAEEMEKHDLFTWPQTIPQVKVQTEAHLQTRERGAAAEIVEAASDRHAGESQYQKTLKAEHIESEERLLALRIGNWQTVEQISLKEASQPERSQPKPKERYTTAQTHTDTRRCARVDTLGATEAISNVYKSTGGKAKESGPKTAARSIDLRAEDIKDAQLFMQPQVLPHLNTKDGEKAQKRIKPAESKGYEESLRQRYVRSLEAERMDCEEKLLALRIRKWQQGMETSQLGAGLTTPKGAPRMDSEDETLQSGTGMPDETPYMEPQEPICTQLGASQSKPGTKAMSCFNNSTRMKARKSDTEPGTVAIDQLPEVMARETKDDDILFTQEQMSPPVQAHTNVHQTTKVRGEAPKRMESSGGKWSGESLREQQSEKSPEAEHLECEEKLLALRIRKWHQDTQMTREETSQPEGGLLLLMPEGTPCVIPEEHIPSLHGEREVTREGPKVMPSCLHKDPVRKAQETDLETATLPSNKVPAIQVKAEEIEDKDLLVRPIGTRPNSKGREVAEKTVEATKDKWSGESLKEHHDQSLNDEHIECKEKQPINKWLENWQITPAEAYCRETDLLVPETTAMCMDPEEHISSIRHKECGLAHDRDMDPRKMKAMETNREASKVATYEFLDLEGNTEKMDEGLLVPPQTSTRVKVVSETSPKSEGRPDAPKRVEPAWIKRSAASLREQHEKSLEADRIECEEELPPPVTKVKQGLEMTQGETCPTEPDLLMPKGTPYVDPEEYVCSQQDLREIIREELEATAPCFRKTTAVLTDDIPRVRTEQIEDKGPSFVPQMPPLSKVQTEARSKTKVAAKTVEPAVGKFSGECLSGQNEKSLEVEERECETKYPAPQIRTWQQGRTDEEPSQPATGQSKPEGKPDVEGGGPVQNVTKREPYRANQNQPVTMITQKSAGAGTRMEQHPTSPPALKGKRQARGLETQPAQMKLPPKNKGGDEKLLFEKTSEERELQLSMENVSELKKCDQFVSEEQALAQRIMQWQKDVLMEHREADKPDAEWTHAYPPIAVERNTEGERRVTETIAPEPPLPNEMISCVRTKYFRSRLDPNEQDESGPWLHGLLPDKGREVRLRRDADLVSEEAAQDQHLPRWPTDVVQLEEGADLESDWAFALPAEPFPNDPLLPQAETARRPSSILEEKSQEEHVSVHKDQAQGTHSLPYRANYKASPPQYSQVESMAVKKEDAGDALPFRRNLPSQPSTVSPASYGLSPLLQGPHEESVVSRHSQSHCPRRSESEQRLTNEEDSSSASSSSKPIGEAAKEEISLCTSADDSKKKPHADLLVAEREVSKELSKVKDPSTHQDMSEHGSVAKMGRRSQDQDIPPGAKPTRSSTLPRESSADSFCPIFLEEISSLKVRAGEMSELSCQFRGDPPPQVTWLKDGHALAHNPDYDITVKSDKSTLTIFYPTADHEGTYDCVISNKHGKSISSASLTLFEKKIVSREKFERGEKPHDSQGQACIETLKIPQAVSQQYLNDANVSQSPTVEIRVDAPTPDPATTEVCNEEQQPQECSVLSSTEPISQQKSTFAFGATAEGPSVVKALESLSCTEDQTAMLECVLLAEPSLEVTWFCSDVPLETTTDKYRAEVDRQVHKVDVRSFTGTDGGTCKCVAKNKMGEVSCTCDVFCQDVVADVVDDVEDVGTQTKSKEPPPQVPSKSRADGHGVPPIISGCGLQQSSAVINVSQIKRAFESDSSPTSFQKQREEPPYSVECVLAQTSPCVELQRHPVQPECGSVRTDPYVVANLPRFTQGLPAARSPELATSTEKVSEIIAVDTNIEELAVRQCGEGVREASELNQATPQKPAGVPEPLMAGQVEVAGEEKMLQMFDKTSSFIPFLSEKVPTVRHSVQTVGPTGQAEKPPSLSEPLKSEKLGEAVKSEGAPEVQGYVVEEKSADVVREWKQELKEGSDVESIYIPEPSLDSGVFISGPPSQLSVQSVVDLTAGDVVGTERGNDENLESLVVRPNVEGPKRVSSESPDSRISGGGQAMGAAVGVMEEEEVTFGAVYEYYNPPTDWARPLSPESEMSIEIGSTVGEEVADGFYTSSSSTEISHSTFHTPKSPSSFHALNSPSSFHTSYSPSSFYTPSSGTPQAFPSSPTQKSPLSDSSDRFFSPVQFLASPVDEGNESVPAEVNVDEQWLRSKSSASDQERVHGVPPAFLKPLTKKKVFENDSLIFLAEVFGLPLPEVNWFRNKTRLTADKRIVMERDGDGVSLTIHCVTKADQGEYICQAINDVGEARSVALVLVVSQEGRVSRAPPAVTHQHVMEFDVEKDDSSRSPSPQEILLEVELDENQVKEFEKQVKIITIPEYTADSKSMVISLDVIPSIYEEGTVDFVTQENENLKIAFEVTEMPPRFIDPICDVETSQSSTAVFECSLMGIPSPVVSWFKGDIKIPQNNRRYLHSSDGEHHFLKICKVTAQDSGVYTCGAVNVVGETLCRASLVVLDAKEFSGQTRGRELTSVSLGGAKVQPQKFDMLVGNMAVDEQQASEIELEFEFQQEADESQRAVRLVATTDGGLSEDRHMSINFDVFAESAKEDKVEFKGKSSDMCSFEFQVTDMAPRCVIPLTDVTAAVGAPVILQCLVSGKPTPTAEWYKDGERVAHGRYIVQEKKTGHFNLLITNASQGDAGEYRCLIQNAAGWIETSALLKVF